MSEDAYSIDEPLERGGCLHTVLVRLLAIVTISIGLWLLLGGIVFSLGEFLFAAVTGA